MQSLVSRWIDLIFRHRAWVAAGLAVSCVLAALQIPQLAVDTDEQRLVRRSGGWAEDLAVFHQAFPALASLSYVLVEGPDAETTFRAATAIAGRMQARPDRFRSVFLPQQSGFLVRHALYFQDLAALEAAEARATALRPVLAALVRDASLAGLAEGLGSAFATEAGSAQARAALLDAVAEAGLRLARGEPAGFGWREWLLPAPAGAERTQILFQAVEDPASSAPNREVVRALEAIVADLGLPGAVTVRLTGEAGLKHDETRAAVRSVSLAGSVSLVALLIILTLGVRSFRTVMATYAALGVGLLWTIAFAARFIGPFNAISIVFVVMFIGLGLDFSIHYCMRALEAFERRGRSPATLTRSSAAAWPGIALAAAATVIGFLAFVPTDYRGLADLGLVSAAGMALAVVATYVVVPLVFAYAGLPTGRVRVPFTGGREWGTPRVGRTPARVVRWMYRHTRSIVAAALLAGLGCALLLPSLRFEFDTLALKDPRAESVRAMRDLQARGVVTPQALALIVPSAEAAAAVAPRIEALPSVAEVITPAGLVPAAQDEKRALLRSIRRELRPGFDVDYRPQALDGAERLAGAQAVLALLDAHRRDAADALRQAMADPGTEGDRSAWAAGWERATVGRWVEDFAEILVLLGARPFGFEDLPEGLRSRLIADDGRRLLRILPAEGFRQGEGLARFVAEVREVAPAATGRPVAEREVARLMLDALYRATAYALIGLGLLLLVALRRPRDVALVLFPIVLAALFTAAVMVAAGLPFNMANILVAPLIFGLGVAGSVQVLRRFRERGSLAGLLESSTPWAVYLSYLTTLVTFGSLILSPHAGMRSIGLLLSIALLFAMACVIVVLSALLHLIAGGGDAPPGAER